MMRHAQLAAPQPEKALTVVVAEGYLLGVSTRKVEDLVQSLGIEKLSNGQASQLSKELDGLVKSFRDRSADKMARHRRAIRPHAGGPGYHAV